MPDDAPTSAFRGLDVADVVDRFSQRWDAIEDELTPDRRNNLAARWDEALTALPHPGPRMWLHGDPHPNNTVLADVGNGVGGPVLVDFGDLCAGDPASDLGSALLHFSSAGRRTFRATYDARRAPDPGHDALWIRARGWSVYYALIFAAQPEGEALRQLGRDYLG